MAKLINRPEYLKQLVENKDVDLVKSDRNSKVREVLTTGSVSPVSVG